MQNTTHPSVPSSLEDLKIREQTRFEGFADQSLRSHPAVSDLTYRARRDAIVQQVMESYNGLPVIEYNDNEIRTWGTVLRKMKDEIPSKACKEYNTMFDVIGFKETEIPKLPELSARLFALSGWRLHAVGGYVPPRVFLNCLSFRVFPVIPFVRHHACPFYSIEPDVCHEMLGHLPMLADKSFADMCCLIGQVSLTCSEESIGKIANVFWHLVEFGLVQQEGHRRAFGAAIVSCIDELHNALSDKPEIKSFDPWVCSEDGEHPLTELQPSYYTASSVPEAIAEVTKFLLSLK